MLKKYIVHILIIGLISISIFLGYKDTDKLKNNKKELVNLEQISIQLKNLMEGVTKNARPPDVTENRIRQNGYTYLSYYYNNPKEEEIKTIRGNLDSNPYWKMVPKRTKDDENIFLSYCYGKIGMNLSRFTFIESANTNGFPRLRINIFYYEKSDCNK